MAAKVDALRKLAKGEYDDKMHAEETCSMGSKIQT